MMPIKLAVGSVEVTIAPKTRFESGDPGLPIYRELSSSWEAVKHIVDRYVQEKYEIYNSVEMQKAKINTIVDIYNTLHNEATVDENDLLKEVLKTGNYSEDEAKSLIKKVKEEKVDGGMAWY